MNIDRRIVRTQKSLKKALLALLEKKAIHSISVTELCELADLNRSTFYDYYKDIYELLHDVYQELFEEMNVFVKGSQKAMKQKDDNAHQACIVAIIDYMQHHNHLFKLLLQQYTEQSFEQQLFQFFSAQLLVQQADVLTNTKERYEFLYHCAGSFAILRQWLFDNCPMSSLQLATIIIHSSLIKENE